MEEFHLSLPLSDFPLFISADVLQLPCISSLVRSV